MSLLTILKANPINGLSADAQKLLETPEARKWQEFIRPGEAHNEIVHQIWFVDMLSPPPRGHNKSGPLDDKSGGPT